MKRVAILACISFIVANAGTGLAQALDVDWKVYGFASVEGTTVCFYDAKGVTHESDGRIKVWTKCLLQKDLDNIDIKKDFDGKILENAAQKVSRYYVPPIAKAESINANQRVTIIQYEETANISYIQPQARIFYELNCAERMSRELSIDVQINGKFDSRDKPSDWKYVPPEGNAAVLLRILCPLR